MKPTTSSPKPTVGKRVVIAPAERTDYWLLKATDLLREAAPDETITITISKTNTEKSGD